MILHKKMVTLLSVDRKKERF